MKALSLLQPWATLVATEEKRIETRSWATEYRGPIVIHASKGFKRSQMELCWQEPFRTALLKHGILMSLYNMPLGAVIATCNIADCVKITDEYGPTLSMNEQIFGDYTPGRYAWPLSDIKKLDSPIKAKGSLGLWNWEP